MRRIFLLVKRIKIVNICSFVEYGYRSLMTRSYDFIQSQQYV